MNKPESLRAHLLATVADFKHDPDRLLIFIDNGKVRCTAAALSRMLENLIRFGVIAAVQMKPPRVKVKTGELTTAWLPWLALRAGSDREWDPEKPAAPSALWTISPSPFPTSSPPVLAPA